MPVLQSKPQRQSSPDLNPANFAKQSTPMQSLPGQYNVVSKNYNAPLPSTSNQVLGASTTYSPSGGAGGGGISAGQSVSLAGFGTAKSNINDQLGTGLAAIDAGYNDYASQIDTQEGNVRRSAADATAGVDTSAQGARTQLNNQLATNNQSYDEQTQKATRQGANAMQQARDIHRQLQQQNVATLSANGLSSSSVAEALAENLGVETARRIAGVTGSRDEVLQNIAKEKTNQANFVKQQLSDLEGKVTTMKNSIQTKLLNDIDSLNNQRNVAASQKANARQQLISDAQGRVADLQANAQNFAQSLEMWQKQNAAKLGKTEIDFGKLNQAANAVQSLAQVGLPMSSAVTQYLQSAGVPVPGDYVPSYTGPINPNKTDKQYDPTDPSTW